MRHTGDIKADNKRYKQTGVIVSGGVRVVTVVPLVDNFGRQHVREKSTRAVEGALAFRKWGALECITKGRVVWPWLAMRASLRSLQASSVNELHQISALPRALARQ